MTIHKLVVLFLRLVSPFVMTVWSLLFKKLEIYRLLMTLMSNNFNYEVRDTYKQSTMTYRLVFKKYGTQNLSDFMEICLDKNYLELNVSRPTIRVMLTC